MIGEGIIEPMSAKVSDRVSLSWVRAMAKRLKTIGKRQGRIFQEGQTR